MKISKKLKQMRKENNLTLKELSNKSGVSISFISDIENGRRNPSIETLKVLASALDTSAGEFLKEEPIKETINKNKDITTIAVHFEGKEFTEEDKYDIENFIKYVLSKKK